MITDLSLAQFKSKVSDFAKPNRFDVVINPPSIYAFNSNQYDMLTWLAQSASIPQRTQGEITLPYHGMELKLPGDYSKENLTISFLNSYGWEGRTFFDRWLEGIQLISYDNSKAYSYDLLEDSFIVVNQLGRTINSVLAAYKFYHVYPTSISSIDLNMSLSDQVETFTVTFAYSYVEKVG